VFCKGSILVAAKRFHGLATVAQGTATRLLCGELAICLVRCDDGRFFAVSDACTHEDDASLSDGWVSGCQIECARHNSIFDLQTGAALSIPAIEPVKTYRTAVDGDDILIEIPNPPGS